MTSITAPQPARTPRKRAKLLRWVLFAVVAGLLHLAHSPAPAYAADEICNLAPDGTLTCPSDPSNEPTPTFAPPELLNPRILAEATPAQADALRRLQEQAVTVVMTRHHLPASDRDEVQSWGRTEAQAALWALVYEAIDTEVQDRTSDQQHAVDWMASLVRAQAVNTAKAAAGEYASWVGLDVDEYWSKVNSGISQDQLTSFLSIDARNYNTVDTDRATSGYCKYRAPAPYESEYTGYLFQTCYTPCTAWDCDAPRPSYEQFVRWGDAAANRSLTSTSHLANAAAIAQAVTISNTLAGVAGLATLTLPVGAAIFSLAVATVVTITPGAFLASGLLGAAFASTAVVAVLAVLAAIAGTIFLSIRLNDELALPAKMAALVVGARDAAYDPATLIETDEGVSTLFGLFADAALPFPDAVRRCDNSLIPVGYYGMPGTTVTVYDPETGQPKFVNANPCLNAPAVAPASETDPRFVIRTPDSVRVTESPSITVAVPDGDDTTPDPAAVVRMSGHWFVQNPQVDGQDSNVQTLGVSYTNWDGEASYATLLENAGSYEFVGVSGQGGGYALEDCGSDGSCWRTYTLRYLGPDGQRYQAYVKPPSAQAQLIELAEIADKRYGGQVTLAATGGPSGQPVTFTAGPQAVCTSSGLNGSKVALVGVGECTVTANQAGDGAGFLAASPVTRSFQVTPAPLDIRAEPKTKTYGAPNPELTALVGPLVNGDTRDDITGLVLTGPPADSGVGQYDIVPSGASNPNYDIRYVTGRLDVQPADLTVTADDKTRVYGATVPTYTAHVDGLVNGDTRDDITGLQFSGPPANAHAGQYPIHVLGATNPNYRFTYRDGTETITPAALTVKPDDKTIKYGTVPAYTWTAVGWVNGDSNGALDTAPTCRATIQGAAASVTTAPGAYLGAITCTGGADRDYAISYASAKLTVNPVIRLSQTGLPATLAKRVTVDGQAVALPYGDAEVALGTRHTYAFPGMVTDAKGVVYMTLTPAFDGSVSTNVIVNATYSTMTSVVDAALTAGGISRNQVTPLKSNWTTVQTYLRAGNLVAARKALREFAALVRSQAGKKITQPTANALLAYAQLVFTSVGGTGTL